MWNSYFPLLALALCLAQPAQVAAENEVHAEYGICSEDDVMPPFGHGDPSDDDAETFSEEGVPFNEAEGFSEGDTSSSHPERSMLTSSDKCP